MEEAESLPVLREEMEEAQSLPVLREEMEEAESLPVLREEMEEAVRSLKAGKSPGADTFPLSCLRVEVRQRQQSGQRYARRYERRRNR